MSEASSPMVWPFWTESFSAPKASTKARLIVFGKVGSGKSTLLNMLHARHPSPEGGFKTSDGIKGTTSSVDVREGNGWISVDTIGLGETKQGTVPDKDARKNLITFLKKTRNEYTYIIFVARKGRFTEETKIHWEIFKQIFKGGESNFVVVYTHANQKWIESSREELKVAYNGHNRFIGVDFPPVPEDDDDFPDEYARNKIRKKSLEELESSLRGYWFTPIKPDTFYMGDTELEKFVEKLITKMKKFIASVYSGLKSSKIAGILWNVFCPIVLQLTT